MTTAIEPVQTAVFAALSADTPFQALADVYDDVPEGAAYPYVVIGSVDEVPDDAHDRRGLTVGVTLHVWSAYKGYQEAARIVAAVDAVLDRQPLTVEGFTNVSAAFVSRTPQRDPDPKLRQIITRYRVWLEQESETEETGDGGA